MSPSEETTRSLGIAAINVPMVKENYIFHLNEVCNLFVVIDCTTFTPCNIMGDKLLLNFGAKFQRNFTCEITKLLSNGNGSVASAKMASRLMMKMFCAELKLFWKYSLRTQSVICKF